MLKLATALHTRAPQVPFQGAKINSGSMMPERRTTIYSPLAQSALDQFASGAPQVRFGSNADDDDTNNAFDSWVNEAAGELGKLFGRFKKGADSASGNAPVESPANPGVPPEKVGTFFNALKTGNVAYLNSHLQQGYSIDVVDEKGQTALMVSAMAAANGKQTDVFAWVLSQNPQINKQDNRGRNALALVLQQKANPATRLNVVSQLAPLLKDDVAQRTKKLEKEGLLENTLIQQSETAMEAAARLSLAPELKALRAAGWPMNQDLSLLVAIQKNEPALLEAILSTPVSFNPDGSQLTVPPVSFELPEGLELMAAELGLAGGPSHVAAKSGNTAALDKLKEAGAPMDEVDPNVGTPLMQAIQGRKLSVVKKLLSFGVDASLQHPKTRQTALEMATSLVIASTSDMSALSDALEIKEALDAYLTGQTPQNPSNPDQPGGGNDGGFDGPLF